ncbi:hypothetical protein TWF506_011142 [Arthrobotrys conoides]|uniref:Uncharacterized protein n=1 Tax=Arthrobotrys conoides TaxID=74498 RepID=A0AAN8RKC2_9PEZI
MTRFKFCTTAVIWLSVLHPTLIDARWVLIEEWGVELRHRVDVENGNVETYNHTINSALKIWDVDKSWTNQECINDVVIDDHTSVRNIVYFTGNPSPLFPYILSEIEIHDGNNCNDENHLTVAFPTERGEEPELYGPREHGDEEGGLLEENDIVEEEEEEEEVQPQNPTWAPNDIKNILDATTIVENDFEQNPEQFDSDEVESMANVNEEIWGPEADLIIPDANTLPQGQYIPTIIVEEEYQNLDTGPDQGGQSQNNLQKRSPLPPPNSESSEEPENPQDLPGFILPGQGFIDVGTVEAPLNAGNNPNGLGQLPMPNFLTNPRPQEQDGFSDVTTIGPVDFGFDGTQMEQLGSPGLNPLATQDVFDLEPLVMESRDVPFEGEDEEPTFKINLHQYGLRFRKDTSIKLISDLNQWYRIPAGGIQIEGNSPEEIPVTKV